MGSLLKITDIPINERPRERLLIYGAEALSNSELLAVILGSGTKNENVLTLGERILTEFNGINGLLSCSIEELLKLNGIGKAKTAQIMALVELSKRFRSYRSGDEYKIVSPKDAADLVMESMRYLKKEYLKVIMLNVKNVIISVKDISIGSLNSSIVHPREVYSEAIKKNSASIILCHNHPSGDPTPSSEDVDVTKRINECGKLLGIELIDHLIIGDGSYISLKEKGIL